MPVDAGFLPDAALSWMGALGAWIALTHMRSSEARSFQERRAVLLLALLSALMLVRGWLWLLGPNRWLFMLTFVPAVLLPIAAVLFVEGLLRRHLPLSMKVAGVALSSVFLILDLAGLLQRDHRYLLAFMVLEIALFAVLGLLLMTRDRASLSPAENRLADGAVLVVLIALPLTATDFRLDLGWPPMRLGALGLLVFVYCLMLLGAPGLLAGSLFSELGRLSLRALVLAGAMLALAGWGDAAHRWRIAGLSLGFTLLAALWDRRAQLRAQVRARSFLGWWAGADLRSLGGFIRDLASCPAAEAHRFLEGNALAGYDLDALAAWAGWRRNGVCSLAELRDTGRGATPDPVKEQLVDLLERHGMNHASLVSGKPPRLLLVSLPQLGGGQVAHWQLSLIQRGASLLARLEDERA
jgi:hypothetical protein